MTGVGTRLRRLAVLAVAVTVMPGVVTTVSVVMAAVVRPRVVTTVSSVLTGVMPGGVPLGEIVPGLVDRVRPVTVAGQAEPVARRALLLATGHSAQLMQTEQRELSGVAQEAQGVASRVAQRA